MRASSANISLSENDAAIVKAMVNRGDRNSDIASWFGVNQGRIAEINTGQEFVLVKPFEGDLPPPGPYVVKDILQRCMELEEVKKQLTEDISYYVDISATLASSNVELCEVLQQFLDIAHKGAWDEEELMDRAHQVLSRADEGE